MIPQLRYFFRALVRESGVRRLPQVICPDRQTVRDFISFHPAFFWSRISIDANGCWMWTDSKNQGYGRFYFGGKSFRAHVLSFEMCKGNIPKGLQLDHLCRNRACVNPLHLELVTRKVNLARGESPSALNSKKTHCPSGHEYTPENTAVYARRWGKYRVCITCSRLRNAKRAAKLKASRLYALGPDKTKASSFPSRVGTPEDSGGEQKKRL